MSICSSEIQQLSALAMLHDIDNKLTQHSELKVSLSNQALSYAEQKSKLDPDSPEAKALENARLKLSHMEKIVDAEIENLKHKRDKAEKKYDSYSEKVKRNIDRAYGRH